MTVRVLYRKPPALCLTDAAPVCTSAPEIVIADATPAHIGRIKRNLRLLDKTEVMGLGLSAQSALWNCYRSAVIRRVALIDGREAAIWGVCGALMGYTGVPFLLTTPVVADVSPLRFARLYQSEVLAMLKIFSRLENYVLSDYHAAIRLLDICGFTIEAPQPMGRHGAHYRKFHKTRGA